MPRDIVLVPTFYRPEYLALCLEHLAAADGGKEKEVWVALDRHTFDRPEQLADSSNISEIVRRYGNTFAKFRYIIRQPHTYIGNPLNFLELYKEAYEQGDARYIYLVEDDVLVAKDFFRWHEAVQARGDYFNTVGWHCIRNDRVKPSTDPNAYVETGQDFSSIGVCWKRDKLAPVVKHANHKYYMDMTNYLHTHFANGPIPRGVWTEQAGLIMRCLLADPAAVIAWPSLSRCAHVGINGYHRRAGYRFMGTLEERIEELRSAAKDTKKIVGLSKDPFDDIAALADIAEWKPEDLQVVQTFGKKG